MNAKSALKLALAVVAVILLALLIVGPMVLGDYGKLCAVTISSETRLDYEMSQSECEDAGGVYE